MEMYLRGRHVRIAGDVEGPDRTVGMYTQVFLPMFILDIDTGQELDWLDLDSPRILSKGEEEAINEAWADTYNYEGDYKWLVWYWAFDTNNERDRQRLFDDWQYHWLRGIKL